MKYLVVGTGGVGGSIAGFLANAGRDVTCIARGSHLEAIRHGGLVLSSDLLGSTSTYKVPAFSVGEYIEMSRKFTEADRPDVVIVSVKGYSLDEVTPVVNAAAQSGTLVIPILNVYGTGPRLQSLVPEATVLDGCIYIVGFKVEPGHICQQGKVFNLIYGARTTQRVPAAKLEQVAVDLRQTGMQVQVSDDINRDTYIKWGFISAMACAGAYHDCPMGPLQKQGPERMTFCGLCRESYAIGVKMGIHMPADYLVQNLSIIDHLDPEATSSMQKDMAAQHESEIRGQLFALADLGHKLGVDVPTYDRVCERFKEFRC